MPAPKQAWSAKSVEESKPWGETRVWHAMSNLHGKLIHIRAGERTSLKYHSIKSEVFFVLSGRVRAIYGNSKTLVSPEKNPYEVRILEPFDVLHVQSECPYRLEALEDCKIIEVGDRADSTPVLLEDDYGRRTR
jgi:mannose-6-phosphate isomerase-like protein (cupin superfamily)